MHTMLVRYRLPGKISLFDAGETCKAFLRLWKHRAGVLHKVRQVRLYALRSALERFKERIEAFKKYKERVSHFFRGWNTYTRIGPLTPGWTSRIPCPHEKMRRMFRRWVENSTPKFRRFLKRKAFASLKLYLKRRRFMKSIFLHWWHYCDLNMTDAKAEKLEAAYLRDQQSIKQLESFKKAKKTKIQNAVDDYKKQMGLLSSSLRPHPPPPIKSLKRSLADVDVSWLMDTKKLRV